MEKTIDLYEAIAQMRKLTARNKPFSFSHATYNRDTNSSDGIRKVEKALLRSRTSNDEISHSDMKLFYREIDTRQQRNCWQVLIMTFNGQKVTLS